MKTGSRTEPIIDPILRVLTGGSRRPIELADDILRASGGLLRPEVRDVIRALGVLQQRDLVRPVGKSGAWRLAFGFDAQPF